MISHLKRIFTLGLAGILLLLSLAGCSQSTNQTDSMENSTGLTEITLCESWNFDGGFSVLQAPALHNGTFGLLYYLDNFYETLVRYENGEIVPGLAERWDVSPDGLTYTFTLQKGIQFSDGEELTAEVVKQNYDNMPSILGDSNGVFGLTSALLDEVTVVDKYTVAVKLTTPYYGALQDFTLPLPNLTYNSFEELSNAPGFTAIASEVTIQSRTMGFNVSREPFNDDTVILAANYAIDTQSISENIYFGVETPADSVLDKELPYCDVNTGSYSYNAEKAKQILEDAGWVDNDGDGVREKNGIPLSGNLLYATDQASLGDLSSVLAAQLNEAGFDITPVGKEQMVYFQDISNGDFDLAIAITNAIPSDPYLLISRCLTDTVIDNYLAQGLAGMEQADTLITSLNAMTDPAEIQATYDILLQELHHEATIVPLTRVKGMATYNTEKISGYTFANQPDYINVDAVVLK